MLLLLALHMATRRIGDGVFVCVLLSDKGRHMNVARGNKRSYAAYGMPQNIWHRLYDGMNMAA